MTYAITPYQGDALSEIRAWGNIPSGERRRACIRALRDRDTAALQDLCIAHLKLRGLKGTKVSTQTVRAYRQGVKVLVQVSEESGLSLIQPPEEFAALFMRTLEGKGYRSATISVRVAAAKELFKAAKWCQALTESPWDGYRVRPESDAVERLPYSDTDLARVLELPEPRIRAAVLLGAHGGLRASEMCALTWADIDLSSETVFVRNGKGGKARQVPMTRPLAEALRALSEPHAGTLLWKDYQKLLKAVHAAFDLAGVEWRGLHALRHTAGTELYRATGDLYVTAELLGHRDIKTTQIYAHMSQDHLRAALKKRAG